MGRYLKNRGMEFLGGKEGRWRRIIQYFTGNGLGRYGENGLRRYGENGLGRYIQQALKYFPKKNYYYYFFFTSSWTLLAT